MKNVRKIKRLFWLAVSSLFLMSGTILFMPIASKAGENNRQVLLLIGTVFWISAIAGYTMLLLANSERKWFLKNKVGIDNKMNCLPGIITFFTNVPATIADVVAILSFVLMVIINFTDRRYDYISYVLLFLLALSLNMHCLFNGRIYKTTKFKRTRRVSGYE